MSAKTSNIITKCFCQWPNEYKTSNFITKYFCPWPPDYEKKLTSLQNTSAHGPINMKTCNIITKYLWPRLPEREKYFIKKYSCPWPN